MPTLRTDKWTRLAAGFGLLLLLVAQQKLCPWLSTPPADAESSTATPQSATTDQQETDRKTPQRLPYLMPDTLATAPRWPTGWSQTTLRLTIGWHDGVVSSGQFDPKTGDTPAWPDAATAPAWHRFLEPIELCGVTEPPACDFIPTDPAVRTIIRRTGPPQS